MHCAVTHLEIQGQLWSPGCGIWILYQLQDVKHPTEVCVTAAKGHHYHNYFKQFQLGARTPEQNFESHLFPEEMEKLKKSPVW